MGKKGRKICEAEMTSGPFNAEQGALLYPPTLLKINTFMGSRKFSDLLFSPLSPFSLSPLPGFLSVFSATDIAPVNKESPAKESRRQFGPSQDAQTKICCAGKYLPRDPSMSIASVQLS